MPDQPSRQDPNQFPALIAHTGTAGTAETIRVLADSAGALHVNIQGTEPFEITAGTVTRISNVGTLEAGTITTGSLTNLAMLHAGTLGTVTNLGQVYNAGTIQNILGGTINAATVTQASRGAVGTIAGIGQGVSLNCVGLNYVRFALEDDTLVSSQLSPSGIDLFGNDVTNILFYNAQTGASTASGSSPVFAGAAAYIIPTVGMGTITVSANSYTSGTARAWLTGNAGNPPFIRSLMTSGTITSLTNLAGGTIQHNENPVHIGTSYGTLGTAGAATWGTLISASGAGTYQYVSGVDITVTSGTVDVAVTNIGIGGSTGAGVLARGQFIPGGGISKNFDPVQRSGTNGTLSYWLGGAGTASIIIQYWQGI